MKNNEVKLKKRIINDTDRFICSKIKIIRESKGIKRTTIANHLGISVQQVDKYERGINRIPASKLLVIANLLETDIRYFFDDIKNEKIKLHEMEVHEFGKAFTQIRNSAHKEAVWSLIIALSAKK